MISHKEQFITRNRNMLHKFENQCELILFFKVMHFLYYFFTLKKLTVIA